MVSAGAAVHPWWWMIEIDHVTKRYGEKVAVEDLI
jgi:hypothetical protein